MMMTRHFIDVGQGTETRRMHFRKAGSGPALLMLHQSPRSSKEFETLMRQWGEHFTCIAMDIPGFGQSEAVPDGDIGAFADATIGFLDALGIEKCAAYGFHSGGMILVTALKRHPERFSTLAIGGYAVWTEEEKDLFGEQYLPPFHPQPYGEHLQWLWNRILEQSWFFPWFAADKDHRLSVAHDDPEVVDVIAREMLEAGDSYRAGYGAVLNAPRDLPASDAEVPPCLISAYDGDPLQTHFDRLGTLPKGWATQKVKTPAEHQSVSLEHLLKSETPTIEAITEADEEGVCPIEAAGFDGLIHWKGNRQSGLLRLHAPGFDLNSVDHGQSLAIDLPGHGLSDDWQGEAPTDWADWLSVLNAVADALGTSDITYAVPPAGDVDQLYPDLSPDRFGCHLNKAWQIVRARHMFRPWYEANVAHAIDFDAADIAPDKLAKDHLALLNARAAKAYHTALLGRQI
ncbi:alpha/beta fold hydrolase [Alterisphingorhabdus coralli]|uniref:Alpha/beta fold hydrolase n=1 Tax=Alterisphingorhabdus coralli TaxID=3071408 RepID=A0AA97I0U3_9SPHN|nr:alpha/beta fold hydrolase [Parasphingorhabdus sp. SCSIO 66989]WOE75362.1 alpha/beta fold hydrolase [Parasphingorhabdus sp. SCSIO 66989]